MIIGLTGFATSGKDEVCKMLMELHPGAKRYSFADALRQELAAGFGVPIEDLQNERKPLYRELLQAWGMTRRNTVAPYYWVMKVAQRIVADEPSLAILTDVRLPNEASFVTHAGGLMVRILRRGVGPVNNHISELALLEYPCADLIPNDGGLSQLRQEVKAFYERNHLAHLSGKVGTETANDALQAALQAA